MTFRLGQVLITRACLSWCESHGVDPIGLVRRHHRGDWGDMSAHDKALNDAAVESGEDRVFSSYNVTPDQKIWVITDAGFEYTTVMLPTCY